MSVLHLVHSPAGLAECLSRLGQGDALVLLEAGVYASLLPADLPGERDAMLNVLADHLICRGIAVTRVQPNFVITDFEGFVELTTRHQSSVNWP